MPTTWTYDATDLATSEKDQIRLLVGDTDSGAWLLADQEITFAISEERNTWAAAARCAEMIGFLFARKVDTKLGRNMQIVYSKTAQQYFKLAQWLRAKSLGTVTPWVGGMSVSDKVAYNQNTDIVAPLFTKTMQENPWTGGYTSDSLPPVGNDSQTGNLDFDSGG